MSAHSMPDELRHLVPPAIFNQEPCFGVLTNSSLSIIAGLSGVNISYKADFLWAPNCPAPA